MSEMYGCFSKGFTYKNRFNVFISRCCLFSQIRAFTFLHCIPSTSLFSPSHWIKYLVVLMVKCILSCIIFSTVYYCEVSTTNIRLCCPLLLLWYCSYPQPVPSPWLHSGGSYRNPPVALRTGKIARQNRYLAFLKTKPIEATGKF